MTRQAEQIAPAEIESAVHEAARAARAASTAMAASDTAQRNCFLERLLSALQDGRESVFAANRRDLQAGRDRGLQESLLDRLELNSSRFAAMCDGVRAIAALADPIGEISGLRPQPSGIRVGQMRVPLGVIGIIYESRPNVTIDAAALCLKAGNAVILRGGSESFYSNQALAACIAVALREAQLPETAAYVVKTRDREAVGVLLQLSEYLDLIVPRGGKALVERVDREARIPVLKHLDGICHVYIDSEADLDMALALALNAKTQRYAVCNAMETLLVNRNVAAEILPRLAAAFLEAGVELRGCAVSRKILPQITAATESDWGEEYLGPILALRTVDGIDEAIAHINRWGSAHTDCIVTRNHMHAMKFLREVDSGSVMINASTRFADGFEYGLGAEIGISTDKLHARGPVGLKGLTTCKYIVLGDGQIRV